MPDLTAEQQKIIEVWEDPEGPNMVVDAVAGSGKTFTLIAAAQNVLENTLAVAFNKAIATELSTRMPPNVECRTLNSLGHRAWMNFTGKRVKLDNDKVFKIVREMFKPETMEPYKDSFAPTLKMIRLAKSNGLVHEHFEGKGYTKGIHTDHYDNWETMAYHNDIDLTEMIYDLARAGLKISCNMALDGIIDFDDQLYMPVCWGVPIEKFPRVMVDEAQDLNPLQHILIGRSVGNRVMIVGDPFQSIYGFRGATQDSMEVFRKKFDCETFPLTYSFRCAKTVVVDAQEYVPHIRYWPEAEDGIVDKITPWNATMMKPREIYLCRNNAPLIALAFKCFRNGLIPDMAGRDIGKGLIALARKVASKNEEMPVEVFDERLSNWHDIELANAQRRGELGKVAQIDDKFQSLQIVMDESPEGTVGDMIAHITKLFGQTQGNVYLSTIHKAKGLEWDRVFFLGRENMPNNFILKALARGKPWAKEALQQEHNLIYVAITRAKRQLTYIELESDE